MIDYILRFPSKEVAVQFGLANGLSSSDNNGATQSSLASHDHALLIVGEHNGDGKWWVLFRDLAGIPIPDGIATFIFWASNQTVTNEHGEFIPAPRPISDDVPALQWA